LFEPNVWGVTSEFWSRDTSSNQTFSCSSQFHRDHLEVDSKSPGVSSNKWFQFDAKPLTITMGKFSQSGHGRTRLEIWPTETGYVFRKLQDAFGERQFLEVHFIWAFLSSRFVMDRDPCFSEMAEIVTERMSWRTQQSKIEEWCKGQTVVVWGPRLHS
jgi:hypothetical protein